MRRNIIIILSLFAIFCLIGSIGYVMAKPEQKTGFDVYIEQYGFTLIEYELSKLKYDDEHLIIMDIILEKDNVLYSYMWVMTKEKYLERSEKV